MFMVSLICLGIFFSTNLVSAQETYFTNDNGVTLTEEEYNFLTKMYWDGYQKIMTKNEYKTFKERDIINGKFNEKSITITDNPITKGSTHATNAKRLNIATACNGQCLVSITLTWLAQPTIRSYDVMGSIFTGSVSRTSSITTRVMSSSGSNVQNNLKLFSNGYGNSFKLPSGSNVIVNQDYYVNPGGHIYASYQHAAKNTTLAVSQNYTLNRAGFGGVFNFTGTARNIYDAMNGVDIAV